MSNTQTSNIQPVPVRTAFFQQPQDFSAAGTQRWSLTRVWIQFFEQLPKVLQNTFTARILLPGTQSVANDVLATRYRVKQPRGVALQAFSITAKVAPASSSFIADILRSSDNGASFASIFKAGNANKAVLPIGSTVTELIPSLNGLAITTLNLNDLIRVDVLQADATVSGIEIAMEGYAL